MKGVFSVFSEMKGVFSMFSETRGVFSNTRGVFSETRGVFPVFSEMKEVFSLLSWLKQFSAIYLHTLFRGGSLAASPSLSFFQISFFIMCPGNFISLFLIVNISVFVVRIFRKTSLLLTCSLYVNLRIRDANYILKKEDKTNQEIYRFYSENVNFIVLTPVHCDILC